MGMWYEFMRILSNNTRFILCAISSSAGTITSYVPNLWFWYLWIQKKLNYFLKKSPMCYIHHRNLTATINRLWNNSYVIFYLKPFFVIPENYTFFTLEVCSRERRYAVSRMISCREWSSVTLYYYYKTREFRRPQRVEVGLTKRRFYTQYKGIHHEEIM